MALLLLAVTLAGACARVRPLEGGPPDKEPPALLRATPPDSTTGVGRLPRFELEFSEKLNAASVRRGIRIEPPVQLGEIEVHGARVVVAVAESLPPDTTVVLVLGKAIQDRKGRDNPLGSEVTLVYATGAALRAAAVFGRVTVKGLPDKRLVVAWEPVPADTGRAARHHRVAACDAEGLFRFAGLPAGRRFRLEAFLDVNGDLRLAEEELSAAHPETLQLAPGEVRRGLSWNVVDPDEPAQISGVASSGAEVRGPVVLAFRLLDPSPGSHPRPRADSTLAARDTVRADTLRPRPLPVPQRPAGPDSAAWATLEPRGFVRRDWVVVAASPRGDYSVRVPPGRHAVLAFVDVRRDSVPGLYVLPDSSGLMWEPIWSGEPVTIGPGEKLRPRSIEIRPASR